MLPTTLPAASASTPSRPVIAVVTKGTASWSSWLRASVVPERARCRASRRQPDAGMAFEVDMAGAYKGAIGRQSSQRTWSAAGAVSKSGRSSRHGRSSG